jgi:hypothetical protein
MKGISQYMKSVRVNEYTCIDSLEIKVKALDSNTQTCPTTEKWVRQHLLFKSQYDDALEHENNMIEEERTQIHT